QGNLYKVRARLTLPGGEIAAGRTGPQDHGHEDPYVAVRDTFDVLRRLRLSGGRRRRAARRARAAGAATACRTRRCACAVSAADTAASCP
ncbi:MAG TPA: hypothetical protein VF216_04895, partial [Mizugakiibacter sp.]